MQVDDLNETQATIDNLTIEQAFDVRSALGRDRCDTAEATLTLIETLAATRGIVSELVLFSRAGKVELDVEFDNGDVFKIKPNVFSINAEQLS